VTNTVENEAIEINWYLVFAIVYSMGILVFLMKFAFDFYSLSKVLKGKIVQQQADFKLIDITENISPFSYFNYIVYNSSLYSKTELENILEHEKVHSEQNHTVDVLISRLFCILFWFNPLVWLYKKAIVQNLEFIADCEASKIISDKKAYQLTLLKITTQENCVAITNHFYQSLIKKRIVMLNKNQSNKRNSWKYAAVLPLLGAFVFFFQVKVVAQEKGATKQEIKPNYIEVTAIKKDSITYPKANEIFINGEKSNQEELDKLNTQEIEQIDLVSVNKKPTLFVTTKNPYNHLSKTIKITDKDIYIDGVKSTNEEFSKLDQNTIDKVDVNSFENTVRITTKGNKPIIIMDGIPKESSFKVEDIPYDQIKEINVLKGKLAQDKYGEKGKNGVVEITTKEKNGKIEIELQRITVEGYGTKKQKEINGWEVNGLSSLDGTKPLIVVNGKTKDPNFNSNDIPKEQIKKIEVLKGKIAEDKYGEKGKNGVIEIETK
jgi:hypothetical protein